MPVPIKGNVPYNCQKSTTIDYSFLFNDAPQRKTVIAGNKDASLLFELWQNGEKVNDAIKINQSKNVTAQDISRLKSLGFLEGDINAVKFTRKGKMVVTTMSLGEKNQFENNKQQKSYTEILASMSKKNKKGFRIASSDPKFATDNSNHLDLTKIFGK